MYKRLCNLPLSIPWPCEGIWSCWGLHLVSPSALFDSPHSVCKQTSFEDICEDDLAASVTHTLFELCSDVIRGWVHAGDGLRTTPWSKSSSYTFDVGDGGCFGCCCSSCAVFFFSTIFWAVDLLTPMRAAILSYTRFSDSFLPDSFSSMQNLYTFSIIALASSLYPHTSFAILLSEVALHVHKTSNMFFANMELMKKFLHICQSKK